LRLQRNGKRPFPLLVYYFHSKINRNGITYE
jgi:hypothetical protein